jgi:hypothetical protein
MAFSGVYAVHGLDIKIGTAGQASTESDMHTIADMESLSISIDGNVEKWNPLDQAGWSRALNTGKGLTISLKGKRNIGDTGNDYVASCTYKTGSDCSTKSSITFPDGAKLEFNGVIDIKTPFGGDTTNVSSLEFDIICDGKPTYTPSTQA